MNGNKVWYKSLGFLGPLLGGVALILNGIWGAEVITQADIAGLTTSFTSTIDSVLAFWTVLSAIIGRAKATKTLTLTKGE